MTQPDKLVVTQEARAAAANVLAKGFNTSAVYEIRDGDYDEHPLVQAFQRAMNQAADDGYDQGVEDAAVVAECHDMRGDTARGIRKLKGGKLDRAIRERTT